MRDYEVEEFGEWRKYKRGKGLKLAQVAPSSSKVRKARQILQLKMHKVWLLVLRHILVSRLVDRSRSCSTTTKHLFQMSATRLLVTL